MNVRITIGFVIVAALLGGLVFGLDKAGVQAPTPTPVGQAQQYPVFQFDDQKITAVTMRDGDTTVRFQKDGDGNWTVGDTGQPANRISLSSILIRLSTQQASSQIADSSADPNGYGLNTPATEITMEFDDGTTQGLQFGDKTPLGSTVNTKKPDAPTVYLIPAQMQADIQRLVASPNEPPTPTPRPTSTATPTPTPGGPADSTTPSAAGTPTP